jgi:hypothetical protein
MRLRVLLLMILMLMLFGANAAAADSTPEEKALATSLFHQAKALLDAGQISPACRKLEESYRLEPAGGTLLNLAVCHEREGKSATAWGEFQRARAMAERDGRDARVALADEHLRALEPTLSKVVLMPAAARHDNDATDGGGGGGAPAEILLDGRAIGRAAWRSPMPVDPGRHIVEARASNKRAWRTEFELRPSGDVQTVTIPDLEDERSPPAVASPPSSSSSSSVLLHDVPVERSSLPASTPVIIAGVIGLGGVALGTWFGARAISKHDASSEACRTNPCSAESEALNDSAKTAADISTGAFAIGLVAVGVGAWLWFTSTDRRAGRATTTTTTPQMR